MKYMGSKSRIKKHIVPIIQKCIDNHNIERYAELFVGGANVIDSIVCKHRYGTDNNKYLISLMLNLDKLEELPDICSKEHYDSVRESYKNQDGKYEDWYIGAIGFLASYNGRFFDGGYAKSGYEKTKKGERFRDYYNESRNNLINQAEKLKGVTFGVRDFFNIKIEKFSNYMIYLDPPYCNTKSYQTSKNFDYILFWEKIRELSLNNLVVVSEENAPEDFECIWEKQTSRSIKSADKSFSTEKLFIHKDSLHKIK